MFLQTGCLCFLDSQQVEREFAFEKGMEDFEGVEKVGRKRPG